MKIGHKVAIMHGSIILAFVMAILILGNYLWVKGYSSLEQNQVRENSLRAYLVWEEQLNNLGSQVDDWAVWDEMYDFASHPQNLDFTERNFTDSTLANLTLNGAVVTDLNGKVLFVKALDLTEKKATALPEEILEHARKIIQQGRVDPNSGVSLKGFVMTREGPALLAIQGILKGDGQGPSPGYLVFVRYSNSELLQYLSRITQNNIRFEQAPAISPEWVSLDDCYEEIVDDRTINAYHPLKDIDGNQDYYLVSSIPRDIYQQGQNQLKSFVMLTLGVGVILIALSFLVFSRTVTRVRKIEAFMKSIIEHEDYSRRIDLPGNDELADAAVLMNKMLNQIEKSQLQIRNLYQSVERELEDRTKVEKTLRYLSMHDPLTGLYNRAYFEEEIKKLENQSVQGLGVVSCDLDGLKIINDTLGHHMGDQLLIQAASVLREVFKNCVVARVGGDEFAVLLYHVTEAELKHYCQKLKTILSSSTINEASIRPKISLGWKYYDGAPMTKTTINQLIKEADDMMYRQKLASSHSNRSALVQGMLEMLKVRDFITEGHSQRLHELVVALGESLDLTESQMTDLTLLAQFHDIGKVGISDHILFKQGELNPEERLEMERHAEIGHRIAQTIPELTPIADFILKHHEWWNGSGYPLRLKGKEIPIQSRILAVADAFDAMTNDRPYRKALTINAALQEIRRFSGRQFDPELVEKFILLVEAGTVLDQASQCS